MNVEAALAEMRSTQEVMARKLDYLTKKVAECREFTARFLKICEKHDIKVVAINTISKRIPRSVSYPFGAYGSVFACGDSKGGRPKIWDAVDEAGVGGGAGNTDQHQLSDKARVLLIDGVYSFKGGAWKRQD